MTFDVVDDVPEPKPLSVLRPKRDSEGKLVRRAGKNGKQGGVELERYTKPANSLATFFIGSDGKPRVRYRGRVRVLKFADED